MLPPALGRLNSRPGKSAVVFIALAALLLWVLPRVPNSAVPFAGNVRAAASDGRFLGCWAGGTVVEVYDINRDTAPRRVASFDHSGVVNVLPQVFSPDGRYLVTWVTATRPGTRQEYYPLHVWDCREGRLAVVLEGDGGIDSFRFSPDSRRLLVVDDYRGKEGPERHSLSLYELPSGRRMVGLVGHPGKVTGVGWTADGAMVATAATDKTLRLWDATTGRQVGSMEADLLRRPLTAMAVSADGGYVVGYLPADQILVAWEVSSGRELARVACAALQATALDEAGGRHRFALLGTRPWAEYVIEHHDGWLPGWAKDWLLARRLRSSVCEFNPQTGELRELLVLPAGSAPLLILPGGDSVLAYRFVGEKRLEWWSLPSGARQWVAALAIAAVGAGMYSLIQWRRARRRLRGGTDLVLPQGVPPYRTKAIAR